MKDKYLYDFKQSLLLHKTPEWIEKRVGKDIYFFVRNRITKGEVRRLWRGSKGLVSFEVIYPLKKITNYYGDIRDYKLGKKYLRNDNDVLGDTISEVCRLLVAHHHKNNMGLMNKFYSYR